MAAIFAFLKSALGTCIKSDTVEFALTELWLTPEALLNEQTGESTFCNLKSNWLFFGWSWGLVTLSYLKYKNPKKLWFHDYKLCGPSPLVHSHVTRLCCALWLPPCWDIFYYKIKSQCKEDLSLGPGRAWTLVHQTRCGSYFCTLFLRKNAIGLQLK